MADQPHESGKTYMGCILCFGQRKWGRMSDENVELAPAANAPQAQADVQRKRAPSHLSLRVLIRTRFVAQAPAQARDPKTADLNHFAVNVDSPLGSWDRQLLAKRHPRHVWELQAGIVIAGHIEKRHIKPADQIFQIVEG